MSFVTNSVLIDLFGIIIAVVIVVITYIKWTYQYWKRRNVPYIEPTIPFGNLEPFYHQTITPGLLLKQFYDKMKNTTTKTKYFGIYFMLSPVLMIMDLDLIKTILIKDFEYFMNRDSYISNEKDDPLNSYHLVALRDNKWRNLRAKLTPTFTSGKMRAMFQNLVDCGDPLEKVLEEKSSKNEVIDIKDVAGCFTTDVIGSCAFGLDCNSFTEANSPFRFYGKRIFKPSLSSAFRFLFTVNFPKISRALGVVTSPKDISDFFLNVVRDTVNYREKNNVNRKDFLQLLLDIKNNKSSEDNDESMLTIEQIASQSFVFFVAGFETSSTLITFATYELARHQDIQDKVRDEIKTVLGKYNGEITYDSVKEMKYLSQVIDESLRMYPPSSNFRRLCNKDYQIPGTNLIIEKNTTLLFPMLAIHYDKEYYPDPDKFDPERFSEVNKQSRHHFSYLPFGEGPRNCIGMRFALMQAKVGLIFLLKNYKFFVNSKTQEPLQMDALARLLTAKGGIWLDVKKI